MKLPITQLLICFCLTLTLVGCEDKSVNISALVIANAHYVTLQKIKNDGTKNLYDDYEKLIASDCDKIIISKNTYAYVYKSLNSSNPYENIVIIKTNGHRVVKFFCFWVDYKRHILIYLLAPNKYVKILEGLQDKRQQADKQIQEKVIQLIKDKKIEQLQQKTIFYFNPKYGKIQKVTTTQ